MKKIARGFLLITSVTAALSMLIAITRGLNRKDRLSRVSDEGYETAHDILFPSKKDGRNVRYGPILPEF